jgi:hypothetical protein
MLINSVSSNDYHSTRRILKVTLFLLLVLEVIATTPSKSKQSFLSTSSHQQQHFSATSSDRNIKQPINNNNMNSNPQNSEDQLDKVCIIGSGNWGSAIATLVGANCARLDHYEDQVNMWVFEETIERKDGSTALLTEVINSQHENVKYLPGVPLPPNVVAVPDLAEACRDATLLIFVLPHQFLPRLLPTIRDAAHPNCRGVSLIKGLGKSSIVVKTSVVTPG